MRNARRVAPITALVAVTAVWGWTFLVVRDAVGHYPVPAFLALRFGIASLCLLPLLRRGGGGGLAAGVAPGVVLALAYLFQTLGLQHTTASKAGLLTGLFVIMTPLLELALYRRRPGMLTVGAVTVALVGTALVAGPGALHGAGGEALGDALEVLTALLVSLHMIVLGRVARGRSASALAVSQMSTACLLFVAAAVPGGGIPMPSLSVWITLFITGALASALAFLVQTYVQQRISPTRTALILVMEPAFALLFGVLLAADRFTGWQALGAALILAALLIHEGAPMFSAAASQAAES